MYYLKLKPYEKLIFLFACNNLCFFAACSSSDLLEDESIVEMNTVETRSSTSDFEPAICYGLEEYNNLLNSFTPAPAPAAQPSNYPGYYGGAYVNDDGKLVILISGNPKVHRDEFVRRCGSEDIVLEKCKYPYVALLNQIEKLHEYVKNGNPQDVIGFGIKDDKNMIEIRLKKLNENTIKKLQNQLRPSLMFYFTEGGVIKTEQVIHSGTQVINPRGYSSTLGFRVMYNGKKCQTIAGHSFYKNEWVSLSNSHYGTCVESNFGGKVDAAIVEIYPTYEPTNNISYTGKILSTTVKSAPVRTYVNLYGQASGNLNGKVTNASFTGAIQAGEEDDVQFMSDIVEVEYTPASNPGDSGGIIYTSNGFINYTTGTHIGKDSKIARSYYTKFENIQALYGVTRY